MQSVQLYNDGRHLEHIPMYFVLCLQTMLLHTHIYNGFANPDSNPLHDDSNPLQT